MTKQEICKVLNVGRNRGIWEALVELGIIALVEDANGKIVPALRVVVHTESECPPPPLPCSMVINSVEAGESGVIIDIEGTLGTDILVTYSFNDGEATGTVDCQENTGTCNLGDAGMYLSTPGTTVYTIYASNDGCETPCSSAIFTNYCSTVYAPESGDDTVYTPDSLPACAGTIVYTEFVNMGGVTGITIDPDTGEITVPAQTIGEGAIYGYYMTCDGVLVATVVVNMANVPLGLRLIFNDIADTADAPMSISDPADETEWNTFFNLPTNGSVFTSAVVAGNQVTLVGGGNMTIVPGTFSGNENIVSVFDDAGVLLDVSEVAFTFALSMEDFVSNTVENIGDISQTGAFMGNTSLNNLQAPALQTMANSFLDGTLMGTAVVNLNFPSLTSLPNAACKDCALLETFAAVIATDVLPFAFQNCIAATLIDIPACVNLGNDPTDATVFDGCTNPALVLNIAAVNATNNGMAPHASIAALLIANPTATVNYI